MTAAKDKKLAGARPQFLRQQVRGRREGEEGDRRREEQQGEEVRDGGRAAT
jgi:hypothetical protein